MKQLWTAEWPLANVSGLYDALQGKTVDLCTVRSYSVAEASLGTLFWTLVAADAAKVAKQVNIYDFMTGNRDTRFPDRLPVRELADLLELPHNVCIYEAEEVSTGPAWVALQSLATQEQSHGALHPAVARELPALRTGERPDGLYRMAEELAVFLQGHDDPSRVQLSAHEKETVALVRSLAFPVSKEYVRIDTGIDGSEFRRDRIPTIATFGSRLLRGKAQGEHYHQFYTATIRALTQRLLTNAEREHPLPENIDALWLADAKERGTFYSSKVRYDESQGLEQISGELRDWSWRNFNVSLESDLEHVRSKRIFDTTMRLSADLVPHLLLCLPESYRVWHMSNDLREGAVTTIERALRAAKPEAIDVDYVVDLLNIAGEMVPNRMKDLFVDCVMAQHLSHDEFRKYIAKLPMSMGGTASIYQRRKAKASLTPEERTHVKGIRAAKAQDYKTVDAVLAGFDPYAAPTREEWDVLFNIDGKSMTRKQQDDWMRLLKRAYENSDNRTFFQYGKEKQPDLLLRIMEWSRP